MSNTDSITTSPWPHRMAILLACATFPLIWVGGLVTTYDAGMAVPDWPSTYGYNLFLYPWQTWISGPWDLFIEHGHRLLGALVGLLTIALVAVSFRCDRRGWVRAMSLIALAMVIAQGVLGGARVLLVDRQLALIHGCFGPLFFAFTMSIVVVTSRGWRQGGAANVGSGGARLQRLTVFTCLLSYVQLVLGALVRHIPVTAEPSSYRVAVLFHLLMALILSAHIAVLVVLVRRRHREVGALQFPALALAALLVVQIALGCGTWVVNWGWPAWLDGFRFAAAYVVVAEGFWQSTTTTAHVATGSLILGTTVVVCLRTFRCFAPSSAAFALAFARVAGSQEQVMLEGIA